MSKLNIVNGKKFTIKNLNKAYNLSAHYPKVNVLQYKPTKNLFAQNRKKMKKVKKMAKNGIKRLNLVSNRQM